MKRFKYKGHDPRLEPGTVYECVLTRSPGGQTHISAHLDSHGRVYKFYRTPFEFCSEWEAVTDGKENRNGQNG